MINAEQLHTKLHNRSAVVAKFAEETFVLDAAGALVWPKHDLLVFSDLHFEKGSFLSQFSNPIPRLDTKDTVLRVRECLHTYNASHVLCLGDSFHDGNAISRMLEDDVSALNKLVNSVDKWTWVLGNHDPEIPKQINGLRANSLQIDHLLFCHEPEELKYQSVQAQIVGHFHPKTRHKLVGRKVSGKCFINDNKTMVLPAFGKYTGGLSVEHKALQELISNENRKQYFTYCGKIIQI